MISIEMTTYGHAEVLSFKEAPVPQIKSKDLLVRVKAVGINPFDLKLLAGNFQSDIKQQMPVIIGGDFSGEVIEIGERVGLFKRGMKVYGSGIAFTGGSGSMAEYLRVNEEKVAMMPENIDYATAAAIVTPACAAQQAISRNLGVKPGQKILIHGAGGAVGELAAQLCLNIGAEVAVTVGSKDILYMKELGADLIINYQVHPFENLIHDFDGVLDTQGGEVLEKSYQVLKKRGKLVSLVQQPDQKMLEKYHLNGMFQSTEITTKMLNIVSFLIEERILRPRTPVIIPFRQAIEAIKDKFENNQTKKIVIRMEE
ncbi:MAG: NADP-dependent oxidoreductase [Bacteroidales bacterium]